MRLPTILAALAATLLTSLDAGGETPPPLDDWPAVQEAARGQHVHWYAWGGETHINDYIAWVADEVNDRYQIRLTQVKLSDTAEAVSRVLAETVAGRETGGAVDLVWINGENFVAMKENDLLHGGSWATRLPNRPLVDMARFGDAIRTDYGVPVEGLQSPWGRAQLVMIYDPARTAEPPQSIEELVAFAEANPGRFAYPQPPDFIGTSFLKQILIAELPDPEILQRPAPDDAKAIVAETLIPILERLHPNLWRSGRVFPRSVADLRRLFADGEIALALTHNQSDARAGVLDGVLPPQATVTTFADGAIGNMHFVAIPHNAADKAGALVVANFLLSPEAQARKADPEVWGDPTVLDVDALPEADRNRFAAEIAVDAPILSEPHVSWTSVIEDVWARAFLE